MTWLILGDFLVSIQPNPKGAATTRPSVLILGLGGGTCASALRRLNPQAMHRHVIRTSCICTWVPSKNIQMLPGIGKYSFFTVANLWEWNPNDVVNLKPPRHATLQGNYCGCGIGCGGADVIAVKFGPPSWALVILTTFEVPGIRVYLLISIRSLINCYIIFDYIQN